jgi:hypothetical protein
MAVVEILGLELHLNRQLVYCTMTSRAIQQRLRVVIIFIDLDIFTLMELIHILKIVLTVPLMD